MDEPDPVTLLVAAASRGDQAAWNELVDRYSSFLVSVIRQYRVSSAETEDIAQIVWLRLVEHLGDIREPRALAKWIMTTARRESLRLLGTERRTLPYDPQHAPEPTQQQGTEDVSDGLLDEERHRVLLEALAELPPRQRKLLLLLIEDPPLSYADVSRRTGIPIGSIGPTRSRALDRMRRSRVMREFLDTREQLSPKGGGRRGTAAMG